MLKINDSAMVILSGIRTRSRDKNTKHPLIVNTTFSKSLIVRCKQRKMKKYKGEEGMYELSFFFSFEKYGDKQCAEKKFYCYPGSKKEGKHL